jgi:hypothetical protein
VFKCTLSSKACLLIQGEAVAEDEPKQEEEQGDLKQQEEPVQEDAEQTPQVRANGVRFFQPYTVLTT